MYALGRTGGRRSINIWPGFVDGLATLLLVVIFVLMVFMIAQYFLTVALSGRDLALQQLREEVSSLANLLSLERADNAELRINVAQLSAELQTSIEARDALSSQLATLSDERESLLAQVASLMSERDKFHAGGFERGLDDGHASGGPGALLHRASYYLVIFVLGGGALLYEGRRRRQTRARGSPRTSRCVRPRAGLRSRARAARSPTAAPRRRDTAPRRALP